jgi:penicillin amidase
MIPLSLLALAVAGAAMAQTGHKVNVTGLERPVEVLRDRWGVPHIYAQTQHDLFFAQGYITAKDRLFQLDLWRRIGTGKLAEVLGPAAIPRDRIARLLLYRGDRDAEWSSYAPDAREIAIAFTDGINAYIRSLNEARPMEFRIAGYDPGLWAPEDVLARIAGLAVTSNLTHEFNNARAVARFGFETINRVLYRYPMTPIEIPRGLDLADIQEDLLRDYQAATGAVRFPGEDGSNNWVAGGALTASGKPLLANDPHRSVTLPSLRKTVHLSGAGWNVIGAGEPALPGVALGHNEQIAFGITTIATDQQDLYVEKLNPGNPNEYSYQGSWHKVEELRQSIRVKGETSPRTIELRYTRHGPIIYEDRNRHRAYALRSVAIEPGTAAYLPALSVARAREWKEFTAAIRRWRGTGHNFVYADRAGNIGWHASGLIPVRKTWNGLLPVPGDSGEFEWAGFVSPDEMPRLFNPAAHYIATANQDTMPEGFRYPVSFRNTEPFRYQRLTEIFQKPASKFTVSDFERIQHDITSIPARRFQSVVRKWHGAGDEVKSLLGWDARLTTDSVDASIFEVWMSKLMEAVVGRDLIPISSWAVVLEKLESNPDEKILAATWQQTVAELTKRLGPDRKAWTWGRLHTIGFRHPIDSSRFHLQPVSRPGDQFTVNQTRGPDFKQEHGASFRQVIDLADWDRSTVTNVPGESGDPASAHYADLLADWAAGRYHPLPFTRKAVEAATIERILLTPGR